VTGLLPGKTALCPKHEKLRHWCHCTAMPPTNKSRKPFTSKTANIHEKTKDENLLLQDNILRPLLFPANSGSPSTVDERQRCP
jgi:hypothetical protein